MFDYKSYIQMSIIVPERLSEQDKKTPDLVSTIRAAISGFFTHHLSCYLTYISSSGHGPISVGMSVLGNIPM